MSLLGSQTIAEFTSHLASGAAASDLHVETRLHWASMTSEY